MQLDEGIQPGRSGTGRVRHALPQPGNVGQRSAFARPTAITWNAFPSACSRVGRATALSLPDISIVSTGNSLETEGVY